MQPDSNACHSLSSNYKINKSYQSWHYWISHLYWLLIWSGHFTWPSLPYPNPFHQKQRTFANSEFPTVAVFADEQAPIPCWFQNDKWPCQIYLRGDWVLGPPKHLLLGWFTRSVRSSAKFCLLRDAAKNCTFYILVGRKFDEEMNMAKWRLVPVLKHGHNSF